ncbi:MAG: efflux transporter outer membrane subunit [Rhodocyclaceae bacterium]|nr:efflux transporter outer membrane subunit [Rhodocyclaceae bacterium]
MRASFFGMAAAFALAACAVAPPYQRPALDVPARFRGQDAPPSEPSLGDLAWWQLYQDPALRRLLETALAQNRDVKIAAARVLEARALVGQSERARLPQVDLTLGGQRGRVVQNGGYVTGALFSGAADVSYEVDLWRRLASLNDAAKANLLATQAARDAVKVGLLSNVATAYFALLTLDAQAAITARTIANRERFFDLTEKMLRHGAASALDASRAEASLAQARAALPDLRRQIAQTENQLQILLGGNPGAVARDTSGAAPLPALPDVPAGLPSSLLERRPDLLQAEANLAAATANVHAAKAALFPTVTLTGNFGSESFSLSSLFSGPSKVWMVGLGLLQPILNAQRNGYVVDAAQARKEQALLQYQGAVAQAFREVADALAARRAYVDAIVAQEQEVQALRDADARVLQRYEGGRSSYFEVIDANASLLAAELQLAQAQRDGLVASVQLYQALGGGWARGTDATAAASVAPAPQPAEEPSP